MAMDMKRTGVLVAVCYSSVVLLHLFSVTTAADSGECMHGFVNFLTLQSLVCRL